MAELRWRLADDDAGQAPLFSDEELVERRVGGGEFRGLEFLHVNARRIINEVPRSSPVPFRYTINPYRGCSHACVYCLAGTTPVLMADGRTKPLAEVRVGDAVLGTARSAASRRYVATEVLDHWSTVKPAYRVALEDGTELVASGDHRFLTECGWKHVTSGEDGDWPRPHVTSEDTLVGTRLGLGVVGVEPLVTELPMFDITTGTGDFVAGGVVSHNCFARPTHDYLGLGIGADFDTKLVVKVNAVERLHAELSPSRWAGDHIAMGTNTDPYQRCEGKYRLTRGIIRVLGQAANPFSILTKSTLILRDLDLLAAAAARTEVRTNFSIGTLDEAVWKATEPGTPHPRRRVEAVARLNEAGIPCGVLVAPVLPGISDSAEQLEAVVNACVAAGAVSVSAIPLHLRPGVREHFLGWLSANRPELAESYERRYRRSYLPRADQQAVSTLVRRLVTKARGRFAPPTATRPVRPATAAGRDAEEGPQRTEGGTQLDLGV